MRSEVTRPDLQRPPAESGPLIGGVPGISAVPATPERDRDEAILSFLRQRLWERAHVGKHDSAAGKVAAEEDKYEPQRLNRKIMWQYDSSAKRIPLLRRHYI
jgi:hypothetical protein